MARRKPATTHGVAVVDKPAGVTSHDVVGMLRRRFGERQVGHAGTLDPDATGVLVVAVGKATRLLRFVEKTRKGYTGEVVLGSSTSTLDSSGDVLATFDMSGVTIDDARARGGRAPRRRHRTGAADGVGDPRRRQAAPRTRPRGHRDRASAPSRDDPPIRRRSTGPNRACLAIDVECSAGTYIRTLADDLGRLLGGGAHLRRPPPDARRGVHAGRGGTARTSANCSRSRARSARSHAVDGRATTSRRSSPTVACSTRWDGEGPWAVFDGRGQLLAVYEAFGDGQAKPAVVLPRLTACRACVSRPIALRSCSS